MSNLSYIPNTINKGYSWLTNKTQNAANSLYDYLNPKNNALKSIDDITKLGVFQKLFEKGYIKPGAMFKLSDSYLKIDNDGKMLFEPLQGIDNFANSLNTITNTALPLAQIFGTGYGIYNSIKQNQLAEKAFKDNQKTAELQRESLRTNLNTFKDEYNRLKSNRSALSLAYGR